MKILFLGPLLVVLSLIVVVSCHKPEDPQPVSKEVTVEGQVIPVFGDSDLELETIYTLSNGVKFKIEEFKFYSTNVNFGGTQMIDYSLYNFRERGPLWFQKTGEFTVGSALNYAIGVDALVNHEDPSLPKLTSWLNVMNTEGMHWSWNTGYIFIAIEGKMDVEVDEVTDCNLSFSYHVAGDEFFTPDQAFTVNPVQLESKKYAVKMKFDFLKFFENEARPIDLNTEFLTHSGPTEVALTEKVSLNFAEAFSPYE